MSFCDIRPRERINCSLGVHSGVTFILPPSCGGGISKGRDGDRLNRDIKSRERWRLLVNNLSSGKNERLFIISISWNLRHPSWLFELDIDIVRLYVLGKVFSGGSTKKNFERPYGPRFSLIYSVAFWDRTFYQNKGLAPHPGRSPSPT